MVINYLDRANLSIAPPGIAADFRLDPVRLGIAFSAFGWLYSGTQLPGGWVVDRVNQRILYPVTTFCWSLATFTLGLAIGMLGLIAMRGAIGFFEAPSFLMNNRIATTWFGERERATRVAVYCSAMFVGLAFLTPLLTRLEVSFGWQWIFFATGVLVPVWAFVFRTLYRDPSEFLGVSAAEIEPIRGSGGIPDMSAVVHLRARQA